MAEASEAGVVRMVVNGSCEEDWPEVLALARRHPSLILPSFGYHPWSVKERTGAWKEALVRHLDLIPSAIGEIGLDRWIENYDLPQQEEVFLWQLELAAARNLPVSIHCLQAWGRLEELLRQGPRPAAGFLLHSYGGPPEMIPSFARLGAYFSLPGYSAHERKQRQRESFRQVPPDRLLLETDAPDQPLPEERKTHHLTDAKTGRPLHHPANLAAVHQFAAELLGEPPGTLAERVEQNFLRLFGGVKARASGSDPHRDTHRDTHRDPHRSSDSSSDSNGDGGDRGDSRAGTGGSG